MCTLRARRRIIDRGTVMRYFSDPATSRDIIIYGPMATIECTSYRTLANVELSGAAKPNYSQRHINVVRVVRFVAAARQPG